MLRQSTDMQLWLNGREEDMPVINAGGIVISNFENDPIAHYSSAFDFFRIYIAKSTIDELSDSAFGKTPEGIRRPDYGTNDPLLFSLALAGAELVERQSADDQLLLDQLALAIHAHLTHAYAGLPRDARPANLGGLAPWQAKRAKAFLEANLSGTVSLAEVAGLCGISPSHFARAFRAATGRPPHRWLLERRVEAAKEALKTSDSPLAEIATVCGFSDPSHFSRVFSQATGETPAAWRRSHGRLIYPLINRGRP
jgi:AraC-like DNA-binding protein